MTYVLLYWPAAEEALDRLEKDPAMVPVLQAVQRTLHKLAVDPFSPRLGTTAFVTQELGGISATPARLDDWYLFWRSGEAPMTIEIILVHRLQL